MVRALQPRVTQSQLGKVLLRSSSNGVRSSRRSDCRSWNSIRRPQRLRQMRQNPAPRPLNSLDGFHDSDVLFLALAAVKGNHLQGITNVVVHLRDHPQTTFDEGLTLSFTHGKDIDQRACYQAHKQVRKQNQIAGGNAIAMKAHIENVTTQSNDN